MNANQTRLGEKKFRLRTALAGAAFLCGAASLARAQTAASTTNTGGDQTVVLPSFAVNETTDKGYLASNSVSATRINTPIADLPFSLTAFTPQFIADTGAIELTDIVTYAAGVRDGSTAFLAGNNVFTIRGFSQTPEHDGFQESAEADNYIDPVDIERVEVVKGPASLLYGTIAPGGTVNYITKRAADNPFVDLSVSGGSYDYARTTIDLNQPLVPKVLLFRIDAAWQNNYQYVQPSQEKTAAIDPTLTWKATPNLTFTSTYQYFERNMTPNIAQYPQLDIATPQSVVNSLNPALGYPGTTSLLVNKTTAENALGFNDSADPGSLSLMGAWPARQNYLSSNDFYRATLQTWNEEADLTLGDHWIARANFNYNSNVNKELFTGVSTFDSAPPNSLAYNASTGIWSVSPAWTAMTTAQQVAAGLAYAQQIMNNPNAVYGTGQPLIDPRRQEYEEIFGHDVIGQAEVIGSYDLPWGKLKPLFGAYSDANYSTLDKWENAGNAASPWFQAWDANPDSPTYYENQNTFLPPGSITTVNAETLSYTTDKAVYALLNASFLDDRLLLNAGLRYNETHSVVTNYLSTAAPSSGQYSKTTPQAGLGYKLTPGLMIYGNYSTSYTPPSSPVLTALGTVNGEPTAVPNGVARPTTGTGYEAGIKTDFLNGRISSTLSVYQIDESDVVQPVGEIINGFSVTITNQDTEVRSKGVEYEITYSPYDNWQIFANISEDDVRYVGEPIGYLYYLGSHPQNTSKTLGNLWTRYNFTAPALSGAWVGGGFQYTGPAVANPTNISFFTPGSMVWNSVIGYDWKWDHRPLTLALHWENMTNTPIYLTSQVRGLPERVMATLTLHL